MNLRVMGKKYSECHGICHGKLATIINYRADWSPRYVPTLTGYHKHRDSDVMARDA